jgi:hypothetical protein
MRNSETQSDPFQMAALHAASRRKDALVAADPGTRAIGGLLDHLSGAMASRQDAADTGQMGVRVCIRSRW